MSDPLVYSLIVFIAFLASVKVFFQNDFMRRYGKNIADMSLYLAVVFMLIAAFLAFFVDFAAAPHSQTVIMAIAWGAVSFVCQLAYSQAMKIGPVSLTVLIVNFALVVPIAYGATFMHESITTAQIFALITLAVAMFLLLYKKEEKKTDAEGKPAEKKRFNRTKWIILTFIVFFGFGIVNTVSTVQQRMYPSELNWFVFISYLTCGVLAFLTVPCSRQKPSFRLNWRITMDMVMCALTLGLHNYMRPIVSRYVPAAVFQSLLSILNILFIAIIGLVCFKDKITKVQWIGVAVSAVSIVLFCI